MTAKKAPSKGGRPSSYKPEYAEQAQKLCLLGATDEAVAWFFGVSLEELALWAWEHREFFDAITPTEAARAEWASAALNRSAARSAAKKRRMASSPSERISNSMRARMWAALKGKTSGGCLSRLGYTLEDLKEHIEERFQPGMSWANYGSWHIDHARPCSSFDLTDEGQFAQCWALDNLQPLWASDNVRKGAKYVSP